MLLLSGRRLPSALWLALLLLPGAALAQRAHPDAGRDLSSVEPWPATVVPKHAVDVILGRPEETSIVLSILCDRDTKIVVAYQSGKNAPVSHTGIQFLKQGRPVEITLANLQPDTRYSYRFMEAGNNQLLTEGTFHTQRPAGSTFTFTVTADSHLDQNADAGLYQRTLADALADVPDFHVDLGDTFMSEKHHTREGATQQYLAQRYYFGQLSRSAPLFLVVGNHDGESPHAHRDSGSLAIWSNASRKAYFPNPVPDGFYTGDATKDPEAGLLQDYYAWQWGDALLVVLNPYWRATGRRTDEGWGLTLGAEQYRWLKKTLEASKARYKFVFIHQLAGGRSDQGRGGIEAAGFGEWGGRNADGSAGFATHRPGWDCSIHQLLARNHVAAVFHGHDHIFARQELDGVIYQEVPQPAFPGSGPPRSATEYGYRSGVILGGAGYMRITISPKEAVVDFVQISGDKTKVAHSYRIAGIEPSGDDRGK